MACFLNLISFSFLFHFYLYHHKFYCKFNIVGDDNDDCDDEKEEADDRKEKTKNIE
jgi:hypothetical protein